MAKRLLKFAVDTYPLYVIATILLALLHALIEGAGFSLLLPIIEGLQSPGTIESTHPVSLVLKDILAYFGLPFTLNVLFIAGISLFFFQAVLEYLRVILAATITERFEIDLRVRLFEKLLYASLEYFHRRKLGDLVNGIVIEAHRSAFAFHHLLGTMISASLVSVYFFVSLLVSWKLTLLTIAIALPLIYFTRGRRRIVKKGQEITQANENFQSATVEFLQGVREIKIYGLAGEISRIFGRTATDASRHEKLLNMLNARYAFVYQVIAVAFLFLLGGIGTFVFKVSTAEMATLLAILMRLSPGVTQLQKSRDNYLGLLSGFEATQKLIKEVEESLLEKGDREQAIVIKELNSSIEVIDGNFAYDGQTEVLKDINIRFDRGKTLAIVGASGAGKSTLVDLVVRFYDPSKGQILVDGENLKNIDLSAWRNLIGFVSQEAFLFNDSIYQNIQYGNLQSAHEDVIFAAQRANAHEFIEALPEGYDTIIGDRGVKLSGGQRQRLALARAILRNPPILILDEATSDLDSKSERLIQDALEEISHDRTVIVIAHRLSTIERADEIIVLDEGLIVERGSHQTLLAQQGKYAEFYNIQFSNN